jgi:copper(I)-binding protein
MSFKSTFTAVLAATVLSSTAAFAEGLMIKDPYARAARPNAPTGAAFMTLMNHSNQDIKVVGVRSDIAKRVELHTHIDKGEGVMQMIEIEGGIMIPAGEMHMMKRGGDHVMLMGLNQSLADGEAISVTFLLENGDEKTVDIPVDNKRTPDHGEGHGDHSGHSGHTSN